jgi:hypothetical protein
MFFCFRTRSLYRLNQCHSFTLLTWGWGGSCVAPNDAFFTSCYASLGPKFPSLSCPFSELCCDRTNKIPRGGGAPAIPSWDCTVSKPHARVGAGNARDNTHVIGHVARRPLRFVAVPMFNDVTPCWLSPFWDHIPQTSDAFVPLPSLQYFLYQCTKTLPFMRRPRATIRSANIGRKFCSHCIGARSFKWRTAGERSWVKSQ